LVASERGGSATLYRRWILYRAQQVHRGRDSRRLQERGHPRYAYDFNKQWRAQIDFQSGAENSSTVGFTWNITKDFQVNPAIYFANYHPDRIMAYIVFTYTFHLWAKDKKEKDQSVPGG
jgi:hypothetical protein